MPTEKSAGTILFNGSPPAFLLLRYQQGHWDFPKGTCEPGESKQETALRELEEETGITKATLLPGFRGTISYSYQRGGKPVHEIVTFFLAETKTKKVTLSPEHTAFAWLPYGQALERLTYQNARNQLRKARIFLQKKKG